MLLYMPSYIHTYVWPHTLPLDSLPFIHASSERFRVKAFVLGILSSHWHRTHHLMAQMHINIYSYAERWQYSFTQSAHTCRSFNRAFDAFAFSAPNSSECAPFGSWPHTPRGCCVLQSCLRSCRCRCRCLACCNHLLISLQFNLLRLNWFSITFHSYSFSSGSSGSSGNVATVRRRRRRRQKLLLCYILSWDFIFLFRCWHLSLI